MTNNTSEDITAEDIRRSLLPNVDHLTYAHVKFEPIILKVAKVRHGPDKKERPVRVDFEPHERCVDRDGKPLHYLPCKGMRVVLATLWGDNGREDWIGKSVELFGNPEVTFGGDKTGGIQIAKMSHIGDAPATVMLKVRRGKSQPFVVQPLKLNEAAKPLEKEHIEEIEKLLNEAKAKEAVTAVVKTKLYQRLKVAGPADEYERVSKLASDRHKALSQPKVDAQSDTATPGPTQTS